MRGPGGRETLGGRPSSPSPWSLVPSGEQNPLRRAGHGGRGGEGQGPGRRPLDWPHSLGIPDTSLRGRSTRTARSVLRSKSVPAVARILEPTGR